MKSYTRRNKYIAWLLVAVWMGVIFCFSAQDGTQSGTLSGRFQDIVLNIARVFSLEGLIEPYIDKLHYLVRKTAHFSEYAVLGILLSRAYLRTGVEGKKRFFLAVLSSALYAASDEIHQLFIPGRQGLFTDVLIDTAGACVGIYIYELCRRIWQNRRKKIK